MSAKPAAKKVEEKKAAPAPAKAAAAKPAAAAAKPAAKPAAKAAAPAKAAAAPTASASRPLVSVRDLKEDKVLEQVVLPAVFIAPIRQDIVHAVHSSMAKNKRQAYSVSAGAGHQHSAESWGTGRAVARIPRVSGGGTSRAGQAAFGNMCRKGRMFAPTKVWRKWHRKINTNQKRFAVASALAASALPGLVFARGHHISNVPEIPLVLDAGVETLTKTSAAIAALKAVGAYEDVIKAKTSRKLRSGKGKLRARRHVQRRGPLVVYAEDGGVVRAFRNLPGVEVAHVDALNLLQLAPGGHLGRFVIWSRAAFSRLNAVFGSTTRVSSQKKGYTLPQPLMHNSDLARLINSDEVQSKVRPAIKATFRAAQKKNPLTNLGARIKLNPYAAVLRRSELVSQERRAAAKKAAIDAKRNKTAVKKSPEATLKAKSAKKHSASKKANYDRLTVEKRADAASAKPVAAEEKKE